MLEAMEQAAEDAQKIRTKPFNLDVQYIFIEKDREALDYLQHVLAESKFAPLIGDRVQLIHGEFTAQVPEIAKFVKKRGRAGRTIFALDQFGYDVDRSGGSPKLVVNSDEARRFREIFELYLSLGSMLPVVEELEGRRWRNQQWETKKGRDKGGRPFDRGSLYAMLTNPLYIGKVKHKSEVFDGEHEAIVSDDIFQKVQASLQRNGRTGGVEVRNRYGAMLICDDQQWQAADPCVGAPAVINVDKVPGFKLFEKAVGNDKHAFLRLMKLSEAKILATDPNKDSLVQTDCPHAGVSLTVGLTGENLGFVRYWPENGQPLYLTAAEGMQPTLKWRTLASWQPAAIRSPGR